MSRDATRVTTGALAIALLITSASSTTDGQSATRRTVWEGVYSPAQAQRGQAMFSASCAACHGADLMGGQSDAGALKGDRFMQDWSHDDLQSLFTFVRSMMPRNKAGSLRDNEYLDILTYLLQQNGFPPGAAELTAPSLAGIQIESKNGPGPMPDFAMVEVVGCLARSSNGVWNLTGAGDPVRTRASTPVTEVDLKAAAARPQGANAFQLVGLYEDLAGDSGHRMMARGILIHAPGGDRLNVAELRMVGAACAP